MRTILVPVDNSAASRPVLAMALALAPQLGATVEALHVGEGSGDTARATAEQLGAPFRAVSGDPLEWIAERAASDVVIAVVVGTRATRGGRRPAGHLALALADRLEKPVVLVPPDACVTQRVRTLLVAMEGARVKADSAKQAMALAAEAGMDLVVIHVDDEESIPCFSDHAQYETDAHAQEFRARYLADSPLARLELRIGVPADEIITAAEKLEPDMLAMGWPQSEDPSRGAVARAIVERSRIPVLLVPTP